MFPNDDPTGTLIVRTKSCFGIAHMTIVLGAEAVLQFDEDGNQKMLDWWTPGGLLNAIQNDVANECLTVVSREGKVLK